MRLLLLTITLTMAMAACSRDREVVRPMPPPAPTVVEVPVPTYVGIPDSLLTPCTWRKSAPLEVMPAVARERRRCLELYEADREAIRKVRGKPVPSEKGQ